MCVAVALAPIFELKVNFGEIYFLALAGEDEKEWDNTKMQIACKKKRADKEREGKSTKEKE